MLLLDLSGLILTLKLTAMQMKMSDVSCNLQGLASLNLRSLTKCQNTSQQMWDN